MKDETKLGIAGCEFSGTQTMYAPILRLLAKGRVTALMAPDQQALELRFGPAMKYSSPEPFSVRLWERGQKQTDLTMFNYGNLDQELRERGPYKRQVDHFCESILERKAPQIDGLTGPVRPFNRSMWTACGTTKKSGVLASRSVSMP
ncbi:MAG: hypothetical protein OXI77_16060 [Chloroflexota bacterium]|nr:hypothetical protein [Chloroflexota bacterium]MDE2909503.1 hypothetical protein [Chloroflexota bacterium]